MLAKRFQKRLPCLSHLFQYLVAALSLAKPLTKYLIHNMSNPGLLDVSSHPVPIVR